MRGYEELLLREALLAGVLGSALVVYGEVLHYAAQLKK